MKTIPDTGPAENLPPFFASLPRRYALCSLEETDGTQTTFIFCLNSPIAAKRFGRIVAFAIAHKMQIGDIAPIETDEVITIAQVFRPDLQNFCLPAGGILRLQTSKTMDTFWQQVTHRENA